MLKFPNFVENFDKKFSGRFKKLLSDKKNLIELLHESKQKGKLWTGVGPNAIRNALLLLITFSTKDTLLEHSVYIKDFFNSKHL